MRQTYSDMHIAYQEMIFAYRYTWQGKHTGRSPGLPIAPTGQEVILKGCVVLHTADGKVIVEFEYSGYLGFLQQLSIMPLG